MSLTLVLNGTRRSFDELTAPALLSDVVAVLGLQPDRVAVEWKGEIVPRPAWPATHVGDDDKVEIVHFVGGGAS